jgi:hypothetical protein
MMGSFRQTVRAITEAVLFDRLGPEAMALAGPVSSFVVAQHSRMPDYLRLPLIALTLLCDWWPLVLGFGRRLHSLPLDRRRPVLSAWKGSRVGVRRNLIKFYESLAVFGWAAERQEDFDG